MELIQYPQENNDKKIVDKIIALENTAWPQDKENNIFGALKLIEQLYLDGEIPGYVFRNILQEYKDDVCIADFTCYKKEKQEGEGK